MDAHQTGQDDPVIKTRTSLHEANEPDRRKPIIRIDDSSDGRTTTLAHINDAAELANTVRASIDSGRDNPFRPDGEIYRMTDPIVDYYKLGPNYSRTQTPSYAEPVRHNKKAAGRSRFWRRAAPANGAGSRGHGGELGTSPESGRAARSCWRKWFCCCCRCSRSGGPKAMMTTTTTTTEKNSRLNSNIDHYNTTTNGKTPDGPIKSQDLIISQSKVADERKARRINGTAERDSNSSAISAHYEPSAASSATRVKHTKVVIIDQEPGEGTRRNISQLSALNGSRRGMTNGTAGAAGAKARARGQEEPSGTATKSTGRCVVS